MRKKEMIERIEALEYKLGPHIDDSKLFMETREPVQTCSICKKLDLEKNMLRVGTVARKRVWIGFGLLGDGEEYVKTTFEHKNCAGRGVEKPKDTHNYKKGYKTINKLYETLKNNLCLRCKKKNGLVKDGEK